MNCWSDIHDKETKQMTLLPADVSDNLNGWQAVVNVIENLKFAKNFFGSNFIHIEVCSFLSTIIELLGAL